MSGKLRVCFVGCGEFAANFVPLFKAHPLVEKVYVCDLLRERAEKYSAKFGVEIIDSFEEALKSPAVNAMAIFAQRHLHGPLVKQALLAGKIDCVVIDSQPAKEFDEANEGLTILDTEYAVEDYAIALNKDNTELLDKVNAALKELTDDGTIQSILDKYITAD